MNNSGEGIGGERLDKTSSTAIDTDIPTWQKKVYDTRNAKPRPEWLRYFDSSYSQYMECLQRGGNTARSIRNMGEAIRNIGEALSLFLVECSKQGSDAKFDPRLFDEVFCASKLKKLDGDKLGSILEMLKKVLGGSVTDQAAWTDGVTALFNHGEP